MVSIALLAGLAVLLAVASLRRPAKLEANIQQLMQGLQQHDQRAVKAVLSPELAQDTNKFMANFEKQLTGPLSTWELLNYKSFKGRGLAHIRIADDLFRLEYSVHAGSRISHACRIDRQIKNLALKFMQNLQIGKLSAAQALTVDAAYPRRQGRQFPPERLDTLHQTLRERSEITALQLNLEESELYRQSIKTDSRVWELKVYHWRNTPEGCRFTVFDLS